MAHTIRDKKKLLNRVRRIQGQIAAVEKALDQEQDCSTILLTIAACRGAINSLMVCRWLSYLDGSEYGQPTLEIKECLATFDPVVQESP